MKRFLSIVAVALIAIACYGKADEKQLQLIKKDGIAVIFDKTKKANLVYKFADTCTASYQGATKIPLKQYIELNAEWNEEWAEASQGFREDWNDRNKKGMTIVDGEADYTIQITIGNFKEMAAWNVWWEICDGKVEIIDNATKEVVVAYNIHEYYEGMSGFKAMRLRNRIAGTLEGLSESCLYFAKKAK